MENPAATQRGFFFPSIACGYTFFIRVGMVWPPRNITVDLCQ
jgi:hypothetical protein